MDVGWNSHVARHRFRVIGTGGGFNFDPLNRPAVRYAGKEEQLPTHANVHYPAVENCMSAVLDGTPLACTGEVHWVTSEV
jgi:hypothetical protein